MTVFDSFINLLQSGMITAFLIHCLGIKRKFQKKAAILVFVTVFFVYLEIQTFFTPFENYGVLLTLLVTGVLSFVFCEKGWIEKCICNVVILMFSVVADDNSRIFKVFLLIFLPEKTKILVMIVRDCLPMFIYGTAENCMSQFITCCFYFPASVDKTMSTLSCYNGIEHNCKIAAGWYFSYLQELPCR